MRFIFNSNISHNLTEDEAELFIKAVSIEGNEAAGFFWYQYWFDYKKDPKNTIAPYLFDKITKAMEANGARLYSFSQRNKTR